MLLSGRTGEGAVGKNSACQMNGGTTLFFKDVNFNPFVGAGSNATVMDDFAINQIDFRFSARGPADIAIIACWQNCAGFRQ
jgi:hypothetical protein